MSKSTQKTSTENEDAFDAFLQVIAGKCGTCGMLSLTRWVVGDCARCWKCAKEQAS